MKIIRYGVRAKEHMPGDDMRASVAFTRTRRARKLNALREAALVAVDRLGRERAVVAMLTVVADSADVIPRDEPSLLLLSASPNSPNLPAALSAVGVAA
ncbi:hypothetical protein [Protaetiibacter intestinalis]|uniref:Uncharacterized protein n=1 Tax=Protaetiibacter intestinalis TaxID=2419774 RepID=A0A387B738_9MICO|nr:hypothetical protein [Protaetiibacter intestinalis]AYF97005.1 hypothetical protein D7I47_01200 [Protaetiibacter intestinalis]